MTEYISNNETLPPYVYEEALQDALNRAKLSKVCEPYNCSTPTCGRLTDNPPRWIGVCRLCSEMGNYSNDPQVQLSRRMGWGATTRLDIVEILTSAINPQTEKNYEVDELLLIAQSDEGQQALCDIWDEGSKYTDNTVGIRRTALKQNNARANQGPDYFDEMVTLPEEEWVYKSLPRPKSPAEKAVEATAVEAQREAEKERVRAAAKAAAEKQLQAALEAVRKLEDQ